jgi:hypothetical protein
MDYLSHSLFTSKTQKHIKFSKDALSVVDGAKTMAHLNMTNWKVLYEQYFQSTFFLKEDSYNQEINYGGLGTQITLLVLKVTYESILKKERITRNPEVPYLEYMFSTNVDEVRTMDNILVLSGTQLNKLPKIYLSNPCKTYKAKVEILAATTEVHSSDLSTVVQLNDRIYNIYDLQYSSIVSDMHGAAIIIQRDVNTPLASFALSKISNIELSGRLMVIDDTAMGKTNLFFTDLYNCLQAYSLINWALQSDKNLITGNIQTDDLAPVIVYKNTFSTEINLLDYEICPTCVVDKYLITKENLISLLIDRVYDDRDGNIYMDNNNITITKVNQNLPKESISEGGKYNIIFDISDLAGNRRTDVFVFTIKDTKAPKMYLSSLGLDFYNGTQGIAITTADFGGQITKQDILDLSIEKIVDTVDGIIPAITYYVSVAISDALSTYDSITKAGTYNIVFTVKDSDDNVTSDLYNILKLTRTNITVIIG